MTDTALRYVAMLKHISQFSWKGTTELQKVLQQDGFEIKVRSIQRDLHKLAEVFPLECDGKNPGGWRWKRDAEQLSFPVLSPQAALTFKLVEEHLEPILPRSTLTYLRPWFEASAKVLDVHGNGLARWPDKIRTLPSGLPLLTPDIDGPAQDVLYEGLLSGKQVEIEYLKRGAAEARTYRIHPLAFVTRYKLVYVACTIDPHENAIHLLLHRIRAARLLDIAACNPPGFDLDAYIASGKFGYRVGHDLIQLEARFSHSAAIHLHESKLANDQELVELDDGWVHVRATVPNNKELRWWLRAFGEEVQIVAPSSLRDEFRATALRMVEHYEACPAIGK